MEIQLSKHVYYKDTSFTFEYEEVKGALLIHCNTEKFTHTVLKTMYSVFSTFKKEAKEAGVTRIFTVSPSPKFVSLFGGSCIRTLTYNNEDYDAVEWILN